MIKKLKNFVVGWCSLISSSVWRILYFSISKIDSTWKLYPRDGLRIPGFEAVAWLIRTSCSLTNKDKLFVAKEQGNVRKCSIIQNYHMSQTTMELDKRMYEEITSTHTTTFFKSISLLIGPGRRSLLYFHGWFSEALKTRTCTRTHAPTNSQECLKPANNF